MKRKTIFIVCTILVAVMLTGKFMLDKMLVVKEYQSPNGEYTLIIEKDTGLFSTTMPGDGGRSSWSVVAILKDASGNTIGVGGDDKCPLLYDSLNVEWDLKNDLVWYAKARSINLKTGTASC